MFLNSDKDLTSIYILIYVSILIVAEKSKHPLQKKGSKAAFFKRSFRPQKRGCRLLAVFLMAAFINAT